MIGYQDICPTMGTFSSVTWIGKEGKVEYVIEMTKKEFGHVFSDEEIEKVVREIIFKKTTSGG